MSILDCYELDPVMEKIYIFWGRWGGILLFLAIYIFFFHSNYRFLEMFLIFFCLK
uniref:Uncharacterized protein n=1 Tax=Anguilla anguilla TaxID=7936 RepID=A0A0E9R2P7_ANGAN